MCFVLQLVIIRKVVVVRCVGVDASCSSIIPPAPEGGGRSLMLRQVWVGRCAVKNRHTMELMKVFRLLKSSF